MCSILACTGSSLSRDAFTDLLMKTVSRGPDDSRVHKVGNGYMGFNRLSIMGPAPSGMQPFHLYENACICNGEIYNFRSLKKQLIDLHYTFVSESDCEVLLPMYEQFGCELFSMLDAEFACVLYDGRTDSWIAARDPIGIRPLYYGKDADGTMLFASEPKNLVGVCDRIRPFPPGCYYKDGSFIRYADPSVVKGACVSKKHAGYRQDDMDTISIEIHDRLIRAVEKRLDSDMPVGFLLSGGLDSSLVCGIAAKKMDTPLKTFAIGMDVDAIDLKYARQVADYIHSDHTEVIITAEDVQNAVEPVIEALGTYDITTIRASIGMYLICKWIHENTDIRVLLTGEISDEMFGYKYTDFAPTPSDFQAEACKRIREIHAYDVLRADRCISVNSLEARVPFGDLDFVDYVMSIDPALKMNTYGIGKYLLRHAFEKDALIPENILMREKAAFSDAVGHSLRDDLMSYASSQISDATWEEECNTYDICTPFTKESLYYRQVFEKYYPGQAAMIPGYWMPNKSWPGCNVNDPSARVLSNYGASGE
ncbi:asparagine synthase (glutamine-hydrolysing) [Lachnospiraceae bacterium KHCPX20]|nr:asparagine synthase (glutamine-hydrolysing) [Lachnospiraceae bacterium KHCPX20]